MNNVYDLFLMNTIIYFKFVLQELPCYIVEIFILFLILDVIITEQCDWIFYFHHEYNMVDTLKSYGGAKMYVCGHNYKQFGFIHNTLYYCNTVSSTLFIYY